MPTLQQIQRFKTLARQKGASEAEIAAEIARKTQEEARQTAQTKATTQTQQTITQPDLNTVQQPEQKKGNFLTRAAKSIVDPALKYGSMVGESVAQASRVGAEKLAGKTSILDVNKNKEEIDQLIKDNMQVIKDMRAEKDPEKKKAYAAMNKELSEKIDALSNPAREIGNKQETFVMNDGDAISDRRKIATTGAKRTAGAAAYAVPGSLGAGTTAAGVVGRAAGAGAIAGGLQGLGNSEGKDLAGTVADTVTGATVGGATAGTFAAVGQALKAVKQSRLSSDVGKKISNAGTEFKKSAYVKAAGRKPILREGGDKLLDKMMKAGIKPGNPDEIIYQADDILIDNAGVIFEKADEFKQNGITIDKKKIIAPLEQKLKNAPAKSQSVIQRVLDFVKADLDRFDDFTPAEAYAMKGDYGPFGNWTSTMDADAVTEAKVWEDVYKNISDLMDESFKKGGYDDFRAVNEIVSTAINAKKYAARAGNVSSNLNTLGLMDTLSGGVGFTAGGVPGFVVGVGVKKAINSPQTATVIGGALEKLGANASQAGNQVANQAGNNVARQVASRMTERALIDASTGSTEPTNNFNSNPEQSNYENGLNNTKDKLNQDNPTSPGINTMDSIPQGATNTHPVFGNATRQEVMLAALEYGLSASERQEVAALYDEFAPQASEFSAMGVTELSKIRTQLATDGYDTSQIDIELEKRGIKRSGEGNASSSPFAPAVSRSLKQLEKISGIDTEDSIFIGGSTTVGKAIKGVGAESKKATDEEFAQKVNQYNSSLNLVIGAINQMLGAGVLNDGEAERLLDTMPNEKTSPADARAWFENARETLGVE